MNLTLNKSRIYFAESVDRWAKQVEDFQRNRYPKVNLVALISDGHNKNI